MFNTDYHLRRSRLILYELTSILCICSESVGTATLSGYVRQQAHIRKSNHLAVVQNNDIVGIMSYNIFISDTTALIFGTAFFVDLFWPERKESSCVRLAWKIFAGMLCAMGFADGLAMTVIVAMRNAYFTGVDAAQAHMLLERYRIPVLCEY